MGFLKRLFGGGQGGGDAYAQNRAKQLVMTPQTMKQLRKYGVTDESRLKLEYFFYTTDEQKAAGLARKLTDMGYVGSHESAVTGNKQFIVNGWTSPMKMDNQTVLDWTALMCDVGREFDCEFDGWGTNPKQD